MSKSANASREVLDYLNRQNRPYSAQDLFQNMGKDLGKTAVVKALEELTSQKKIKEKVYGKQKVYVADQSQFPDVNESEIKSMDQQINTLTQQIQTQQDQIRKLEAELKSYASALTTDQARAECEKTHQQITTIKAKINKLKEGRVLVSKEDREKVQKRRVLCVKEWRKRKRMSNDIVNAILEGYPKTKKQLLEEIGIETDEEYNVQPPEI
ncbi:homologous-pairing protein 2 homolog [Littorina saxatilis]|uniref:Homologous-pairing protein 2 homolog n=1 Tax=Littorina saxatilis TaxID=31220 RepID=A0AAN9BTK1_9CAEN